MVLADRRANDIPKFCFRGARQVRLRSATGKGVEAPRQESATRTDRHRDLWQPPPPKTGTAARTKPPAENPLQDEKPNGETRRAQRIFQATETKILADKIRAVLRFGNAKTPSRKGAESRIEWRVLMCSLRLSALASLRFKPFDFFNRRANRNRSFPPVILHFSFSNNHYSFEQSRS